jgi:tetratricopeptide (TPR) repeat protein
MDSARNDFTRERDAKRDTGDTAMATVRSQIAALSQSQAEAHKALAEMAYAMGAIRNDLARQRDAFQEGARLRDAEREAGNAALAVLQSQIDSLKQLLASPDFGPQDKGFAAEGPEASAPAQHGRQQTIGGPIEEKPGLRPPVDKYEAQKLRSAAGEAFTRGDFLETLRLLDAIDAAFPDNKSILYNRAECLVKLGRNAEARTLCDYLIVRLGHLPAEALKNRIVD